MESHSPEDQSQGSTSASQFHDAQLIDTSTNKVGFFSLPRELRDHIYELVLDVADIGSLDPQKRSKYRPFALWAPVRAGQVVAKVGRKGGIKFSRYTGRGSPNRGVLFKLCRQVYLEAWDASLRVNHFRCRDPGALHEFLRWLANLQDGLTKLRFVSAILHHNTLDDLESIKDMSRLMKCCSSLRVAELKLSHYNYLSHEDENPFEMTMAVLEQHMMLTQTLRQLPNHPANIKLQYTLKRCHKGLHCSRCVDYRPLQKKANQALIRAATNIRQWAEDPSAGVPSLEKLREAFGELQVSVHERDNRMALEGIPWIRKW